MAGNVTNQQTLPMTVGVTYYSEIVWRKRCHRDLLSQSVPKQIYGFKSEVLFSTYRWQPVNRRMFNW